MNRRAKIGQVALVLTVLLALAFGARQALARPQTYCNPPGACSTQPQCQQLCDVFQYGTTGVCRNGCCWCYE